MILNEEKMERVVWYGLVMCKKRTINTLMNKSDLNYIKDRKRFKITLVEFHVN